MAIRHTTHVLKNSDIVNRPLPSTLLAGEPIVNTADGIMYFSGVTTSTDEWTPAGTGTTANFFEVGSNLYDLRLRNQITEYQSASGSGLVGKFLSGTTSGFVLANITDIAASTDSYTTGATWNPNVLTIGLNQGKPSVTVDISTFSGLTVSGTLSATTIDGATILSGGTNLNTLFQPFGQDNYTTGSTLIGSTIYYNTVNALSAYTTDLSTLDVNDNFTTGATLIGSTAYFNTKDALSAYTLDLSTLDVNDTFVTGGTVSYSGPNATLTLKRNDAVNISITGLTDVQTTGATLVGSTAYFNTNSALSAYTLDLSTLEVNDTYVTGFTYSNNNLTIKRNQGEPDLTVNISVMTGLTVNGNLVVTGQTTTNNLLVSGSVLGSLIPNTGCTYDLGSSTNRWGDVWANKVKVGTCTTTLEDDNTQFIVSVGGTSSGATFNLNGGAMNVGGDLLPTVTGIYDLGSVSKKWDTVNANNIVATGVTISGLGNNRVVYTNGSGALATESTFTYTEGTDTMVVGNINVTNGTGTTATIGQGGLVVGSGGSISTPGTGSLVVHGDLTVFGDTTTVSTSELYVEDPQITLNYSTGTTSSTSIASGVRIQDGDGLGNDVLLTVAQMNTFTGGDVTEYTAATGYTNRAFLTQLNDIVIRNTNSNNGAPDGVRVLAENDILMGGVY